MADLAIYLDLDGAWETERLGIPSRELRSWGPRLRYSAPRGVVEEFAGVVRVEGLPPVVLYGSGDFHYLAAVFLRRVREPVSLMSFDNHPDWDIRLPYYGCGGWINRALELPLVRQAAVWGCGNFEFSAPNWWFRNRVQVQEGRLRVYPWVERQPDKVRGRMACITREGWRQAFVESLGAQTAFYVTIDLDSLASDHAATNWEQGLFTPEDLLWACAQLATAGRRLVGLDICGAYSPPRYARWKQRFAGWFDHPRLPQMGLAEAQRRNHETLGKLLPGLMKLVDNGANGGRDARVT
ncbi:MAG: hypothetical protein WCI73_11000 [Phycisphaerae bacterium]